MAKKRKRKTFELPADWVQKTLDNDYTLARWAAMFEAVNLIGDHCVDRNKQFGDVDLKPLAIQKFVDYKSDEIMQEISRNKRYEAKR